MTFARRPVALAATLGSAALFATAVVVLQPSEAAPPAELLPLIQRMEGYDTLYLRVAHGFDLPSGLYADQFLIYAAGDGRVTVDLDSGEGYRWYFDGRDLHTNVNPACGPRCKPLPTSDALARGLAYVFQQVRVGFKDVDIVRASPLGRPFVPDREGYQQDLAGTWLRLTPRREALPFEIHVRVARDWPRQILLTGPNVGGDGRNLTELAALEIERNVPVPIGTFQRVRTPGPPCIGPGGHGMAILSDGLCIPPHFDTTVEKCLPPLLTRPSDGYDDKHDGKHLDKHDDKVEPKNAELEKYYDWQPCEMVHPPFQSVSAYRKNGTCYAGPGQFLPDGKPGC